MTIINVVSFTVGLLFSIGLALSGMTQPQKIINFLDPWHWDPSLLFVMIGAVGVHAISYPLIMRRNSPLLDSRWHVSNRKDLTVRLILGSAIFGIGWGLGGYCPGPGVTSLVSGNIQSIAFVGGMLIGMFLFKKNDPALKLRK
jgi:uncharacterized membrane protein YedE/YeeE